MLSVKSVSFDRISYLLMPIARRLCWAMHSAGVLFCLITPQANRNVGASSHRNHLQQQNRNRAAAEQGSMNLNPLIPPNNFHPNNLCRFLFQVSSLSPCARPSSRSATCLSLERNTANRKIAFSQVLLRWRRTWKLTHQRQLDLAQCFPVLSPPLHRQDRRPLRR